MAEQEGALPGLQLRFFLDLLKRRRWLILPLALLGVLVGAVTSFFIPRYYRAQTQFVIKNIAIEATFLGPDEDPMEAEVEMARYTITTGPQFLKAARDLQWPEYFSSDPDDENVRRLVEAGRNRVRVFPVTSQKQACHVGISYADKDAGRAAAMANRLRIQWLEDRIRKVTSELQGNLVQARDMVNKAQKRLESATNLLRIFSESNRIRPDAVASQGRFKDRDVFDVRDGLDASIREKEAAIAALEKTVAGLEKRLADTPRTLEETGQDPLANDPYIMRCTREILRLQTARDNIKARWESKRQTYQLHIDRLREQIRLYREQLGAGRDGSPRPNPVFTRLNAEFEEARDNLAALKSSLEKTREHRREADEMCRDHPKILEEVGQLQRDVKDAEELLASRKKDYHAQEKKINYFNVRTQFEMTSEAYPPPLPNDPATWVITLIGFAIGIGVAVGLIVLTEVLRISFRSLEEAERVLSVPVLGAVGYVETLEENRLIRRRRFLLTAASLVVLLAVTVIVGIYLYDDTRLPTFMAQVLDRVFGVG